MWLKVKWLGIGVAVAIVTFGLYLAREDYIVTKNQVNGILQYLAAAQQQAVKSEAEKKPNATPSTGSSKAHN